MVRVGIRAYTSPASVGLQHSFLLGNFRGGLTEPLETLQFDEIKVSFEYLRVLIELKHDKFMTRRTALYQEILHQCSSDSNPHGWAERVRKSSYRLGYLTSMEEPPTLVPLEQERELLVAPFVRKHASSPDVIIVPISSVGPVCGRCCDGCTECTAGRVDDHETSYFLDGKIERVRTREIGAIAIDREFTKEQQQALDALANSLSNLKE